MQANRIWLTGLCLVSLIVLLVQPGNAQRRQNQIVSPQVHEDGRVTFRVQAPKATEIFIRSGEIERILDNPDMKMSKGDEGVWSLTLGPIPPGIYDYRIEIDGVQNTDPRSPSVFGNRQGSRGYVEVPGLAGKPRHDEWRDVPHGSMTMHWYESSAADGERRRIHVYTPPGYYKNADQKYPVLYLFHGSGDNDSHWMWMGRANTVMDNLLADGKAVPMIIVMPDGHVPIHRKENEENSVYRARANEAFERDILDEVIPLAESCYRIKKGRKYQAVTGLSMGGGQSLRVGLNNLDQFAWIGAFSSAPRGMESVFEKLGADTKKTNKQINLLWIAIGKDDFLLERNHDFIKQLNELKIDHTYLETEGTHQWSVWRRYLADFIPLLFTNS